MALDKKQFQEKLKGAASKMKAAGRSNEEIQGFINKKKEEYRAKYGEGKTQELETEDATAAQEAGASKQEDTLSESDRQLEELKHKAAANSAAAILGVPPAIADKVAALTSGSADFLSNLARTPAQLTYAAIETGLSIFDPEAVDTAEEKKFLKMMIENSTPQAAGLTKAADDLEGVAEDFRYATKQHDKTIGQQFAQGEIGAAIDQTVQQALFSAPSVAAAFAGPGGLAALGGSTFGGKFEDEFEKDPSQSAGKLFLVSAASAGIEIASEAVTAGIAGRAKALISGKGKKAAGDYIQGTIATILKEANLEGASEVAATVANKYLDQLAFGREVDLQELVTESVDAYIVGGFIGGGIAGVGQAGAPRRVEQRIIDEKVKPDAVKEEVKKEVNDINNLQQVKDTPGVEETIAEKEQKIQDIIADNADVADNIPQEEVVEVIENNKLLSEVEKILENPEVPQATKDAVEAEAEAKKERNQEIYDNAKDLTTNTTQAINTVNYWNQTDTTSLPKEEADAAAVEAQQTELKVNKKLEAESLPDTPVSESTKKEIERGNVEGIIQADGSLKYAIVKGTAIGAVKGTGKRVVLPGKKVGEQKVRAIEEATPESAARLEALEAQYGTGVLGQLEIELKEGAIVGRDPKTGLPIRVKPAITQGAISGKYAELAAAENTRKVSEAVGYYETIPEGPAVKEINKIIQDADASVEAQTPATETPGLSTALGKFDRIAKLLKTGSALRNHQINTTGEDVAISKQHKALSAAFAPFRAVKQANDAVKGIDAKIAIENAKKPTTNEQGQTTGGPDPAKIEALELQKDEALSDLDEAVNNLPEDYEIPEVNLEQAILPSDLAARDQSRIDSINNQLAGLKPNKRNAKKIARLKRQLKALKDRGVSPDGFSNAQIKRYIKDLKRGGKIKTLSDDAAAKFGGLKKKSNKRINDMAVNLAKFTISRANVHNFGALNNDIIQEANIATLEALKKFKGSTKNDLLSAVSGSIKNRLTTYRRATKALPLPTKVQTLANKIRKTEEGLLTELERLPSDGEIADVLNIDQADVADVRNSIFINQALAGSDIILEGGDGEKVRLLETIKDVKKASVDNRSLSQVLFSRAEIQEIDAAVKRGVLDVDAIVDQYVDKLKGKEISRKLETAGAQGNLVEAVVLPKNKNYSARTAINNIKELLKIEAYNRLTDIQVEKGYREQVYKPGPSFAIQEGGTTINSDRGTPAVTEINTHNEFDQQTLLDDIDHILDNYTDQLDAGQWVAWTPGKVGRDHVKSRKMEEKAALVKEYVEDNGYSFVKDNTNPGLYRIEAPTAFNIEEGSTEFVQHNDIHKAKGQLAQLNIGLENNPQDLQGTIDALNADPRVTLGTTEQVNGEFDGQVERTVVANVKFDGTKAEFDALVEGLSNDLTQIAIGTQFAGEGTLTYGTAHKDAKEFGGFNPDYFITPRGYNPGDVWASAITDHMKKVWPNIGLAAHRGGYESVRKYVESQTGRPIPPNVKGFQWGNLIAIDPFKATPDTYIHEYVHIWVRGLQRTNPKLWKKGVELLKGSEFMRIINENPAYNHLKENNLSEFYNEVMANAAGKRGAELFQGKKVSQWNAWLKEFGNSIKKMLNISSKKDYNDLTLNDFLDVVVQGTTTQSYDQVAAPDPAFSLAEEGRKFNKVKYIEDILNDPLVYKNNSPYKHSKVDQATRNFLKGQRQAFKGKSQEFTEAQLDELTALIEDRIDAGRTDQISKRADIKEKREQIAEEAGNIITGIAGQNPETLNHNDIEALARENTKFFNRLKTRGIGGIIADALAPSTNDDFYGLTGRLLLGKKGSIREDAAKKVANYLYEPLERGNKNYLKNKYEIKSNYDALVSSLGNGNIDKGNTLLRKSSKIKVGKSTLTNSQAAMVYNYIKDPRLHNQLSKAGINIDKANEIIDYINKNNNIKSFANDVPKVYQKFTHKLNAKLDQHGYRGVDAAIIDTQGLDQDNIDLLNKIYDGKIPETAPYTPVFARGDESLELTEELFEGGKKGDFYTVMSGRLKERNYQGAINFAGKDLQTQLDSYIGNGGPVRTEAFLDFAKNSSAFFTSDNLKALTASLGNSWKTSMQDNLKRVITGSNRGTNAPESVSKLDKWLNRSIGNVLFLNPRSAVLQLISMGNFAVGNPQQYVKYVGTAKAKKARSIIMNSEFMKDRKRLGQTDVVTQELLSQQGDSEFTRGIDRISDFGYSLTKAADGIAIGIGGAPYLAAKIDEYGGDVDRAMQDFIVKANEAQQSTNPERLGRDQTHPVGRYLLAFTNATQQFNRIMAKSAREIAAGENVAANASRISYYMGVQIAGFSFLQKAVWSALDFDDDDDKQKVGDFFTTIIDTIASSAGILGTVYATTVQAAKQYLRNLDEEGKLKRGADQKILNEFINISPAIGTKLRNIKNAIKDPYKQSAGPIDIDPKVAKIASAIQVSGIPTERVLKLLEQMNDLGAQDLYVLEKALRVLGWSRYDIEAQLGKAEADPRARTRPRTLRDREREDRAKARENR